MYNDIRHGLRLLLRTPAITATAVLALALAIGANTAVFTVLNSVLFEPLPYPNPNRLVSGAVRFTGIGSPDNRLSASPPEFMDLRRFSTAFSASAAFINNNFNIHVGELPERIPGANATAEFFDVLGIKPRIGRTFATGEDQPGNGNVVVLSHSLWQRRFDADANVIGREFNIDGRALTVIGVMPEGFSYPPDSEMWAPLAFTNEQLAPAFRGNHYLRIVARIKPDLALQQANADMERVSTQIRENAPEYRYAERDFAVLIRPLLEDFVGEIRPALLLLMGAVVLVLLIACANVANLMLVRASIRAREIGIRTALGAGRARLIRQLLTESVVLSFSGAIAGFGLAWLAVRAIADLGAQAFPRLADTEIDVSTLSFTILAAIGTGLIFGIVPAVQVSGSKIYETLKEGGRSASAGGTKQRLRRALVVAEIALSLALVCGAGLLIKSFLKLQAVDPGFRPEGVLTLRVLLPPNRYSESEAILGFFRNVTERVRAIPGVRSAGAISALPLSGDGGSGTVTIDTTAVPLDQTTPEADQRIVAPGYFETMGTTLLAGRFFEDRDKETSEPVAIVDETLAKTYWPDEDPVGRRIRIGGRRTAQPRPWRTIVGVVKHTRYRSLEQVSRVQMYVPFAQAPQVGMSLAIQSDLDPAMIARTVQRDIVRLDPDQPIYAVRPMTGLMADALRRRELVLALMAAFAGIALVLAALGIYGVASHWVTQRSNEIGIRLALGATHGDVLRMVVGQSIKIVTAGVGIGLAASLALTQLLERMLFNVAPTDVPTLAWVSGSLLAVGLLASAIPAIRATRIDPVHALRGE